ncbi:unnamed protein product, partial [Polarella glacialis]
RSKEGAPARSPRIAANPVLVVVGTSPKETDDLEKTSRGASSVVLSYNADDEIATMDSSRARTILEESHGSSVCTLGNALKMLGVLAFVAVGMVVAAVLGKQMVQVAEYLDSLGIAAHALILVLFLWSGFPIGPSWSFLCAIAGFAFGWYGVLDAMAGTQISATVNFYASRYLIAAWAQRKIHGLESKKRLYLMAAKSVMEMPRSGMLMLMVLRVSPVPFGVTNYLVGSMCPDIGILPFLLSTLIGSQPYVLLMVNLGRWDAASL